MAIVPIPAPDLSQAPEPAQGQFVHFPNSPFELFQPYAPAGDQPTAIAQLTEGIVQGESFQILLGVTGSGKTFTMANVIAQLVEHVATLLVYVAVQYNSLPADWQHYQRSIKN